MVWRGLSLPSNQQVTLTPKTKVQTLDVAVSPPWWRTPSAAFRRCLCLLISKWHWLQKTQVTTLDAWVVCLFDQQVTLTLKTQVLTLDVVWKWKNYCKVCYIYINPKKQVLPLDRDGGVSIFWSASDNEPKNPSSNFLDGGLSLPFDQEVTLSPKTKVLDFKGGVVSPLVNTFCSSHGHSTKMITIPQQYLSTLR